MKTVYGDDAIIDRGVSAFDQIGSDDAVIVVRDVSELRAAFHVAERVNARRVCFQSLVHFDEAVLVGFDPADERFNVSVFGVRPTAASRCEPVSVRSPSGVRTVR